MRVIGNGLTNHGTLQAIDGGRLILEPLGSSNSTGTIRGASGGTIELVVNGGTTWGNTGTSLPFWHSRATRGRYRCSEATL